MKIARLQTLQRQASHCLPWLRLAWAAATVRVTEA